jgi:peptide/nickel transport system ATP-binding protein
MNISCKLHAALWIARFEYARSVDTGFEKEPDAPLLTVRDLRVGFGGREAVRGVSLSIAAGETLGLVGESGSGKSLTSLAVMGLLGPAAAISGSVRLSGEELLTLPEPAMRRLRGSAVAMVFQEPMTALNPVMKVGRQIAEALLAHHPKTSRAEVKARVAAAMREVGLPEARIGDYPHQFSGGQRQRIVIAMALMNKPRLLIADEPTTALDVTVQAQVLALLRELKDRHRLGMLFISHDLAVVAQVADRIAVMRAGEIVEMGAVDQVMLRPQHAYTRALLASVPTMRTDRDKSLASI